MRLNPIVDLRRNFVLKLLSFHRLLVHKELLNKDFGETLLELVVCVPHDWSVLPEVDLRTAHWGTIIAGGLVTVSHVQSEHQLV